MKTNPFAFSVAILAAIVLTCGGATVKGRLSGRWGFAGDMDRAAQRLERTPELFGDWDLQDVAELGASAQALLQCAGHLHRSYVNRTTGETVDVAVLVGPPGPLSVHTPDVCYSARQYELVDEPRRETLAGRGTQSLWAVPIRTRDVDAQPFSVYYGWSSDGEHWEAAEQPRWRYGGRPYLYKLQLAGRAAAASPDKNEAACRHFLEDFLPVLTAQLRSVDRP